jgi:hypothetical protein
MFTEKEREELRGALVSAANADAKLSGAAHLGSAAISRVDAWSDIDLALCVAPGASLADAVSAWTTRMYERHDAVAHFDVRRGETLYRVFLLKNTLQVDLSFWPATEFRAAGPKFKLIFGKANEPAAAPAASAANSIGMAWLYALHVRSSLERGRLLQAEYMLSGMRDEALALACMRCGVETIQGRGFDDLPEEEKDAFAACYPRGMTQAELRRAFQATMRALLAEIRRQDGGLAGRIEATLREVAGEQRQAEDV